MDITQPEHTTPEPAETNNPYRQELENDGLSKEWVLDHFAEDPISLAEQNNHIHCSDRDSDLATQMAGYSEIARLSGVKIDTTGIESMEALYQRYRQAVDLKTKELSAIVRQKDEYLPDKNPINETCFTETSLAYLTVLYCQKHSHRALSQNFLQAWTNDINQAISNYPQYVNKDEITNQFFHFLYPPSQVPEQYSEFDTAIYETEHKYKSQIISRMSSEHPTLQLPKSDTKLSYVATVRTFSHLGDRINQRLRYYKQTHFIPEANPETGRDYNSYPGGIFDQFKLADEIAWGDRPEVESATRTRIRDIRDKLSEDKRQARLATPSAKLDEPAITPPDVKSWKIKTTGLFVELTCKLYKDKGKSYFLNKCQELSPLIASCGLDPNLAISIWTEKFKYDENEITREFDWAAQTIEKNVKAIKKLEIKRPGITLELHNRFGIINFASFPADALIDQFDNMDNTTAEYGIVAYPYADWNGAFKDDKAQINSVYRDAKKLGIKLRITEAGSTLSLAKTLVRYHQLYSPLISFALIAGHGTPDSIKFGNQSKPGDQLLTSNLNPGNLRISKFFQELAPICFFSCSIGKKEGIAHHLGVNTGLQVVGPESDSYPTSIHLRRKNQRLVIEAKYKTGNKKVIANKYDQNSPLPINSPLSNSLSW